MVGVEKGRLKQLIPFFVWLFPVLFLIDNVLGTNGYQFTIAGKSIRIILFCLTVAVLGAYCIWVLYSEHISLFPRKDGRKNLFNFLKPIDYFALAFIFGNMLWATVVPLVVRGEMNYALKDYSTILVLVLYFPIAFLIRTGHLKLELLEKISYLLILLLALWHIVMYVGDVLSPGFYESYYEFLKVISFGTAVISPVVYGFGIVRVIQVTSLFLLLGVFLAVRYIMKGKYIHIISLVLLTFAICVTFTKSIWFGYVLGLLLYLVPVALLKGEKKIRIRAVLTLLLALLVIVVLNYTVFNNLIFQRAFNTVRTKESVNQLQQELDQLWLDRYIASQQGETLSDPNSPTENLPSMEEIDKQIKEKENQIRDAAGTQEANLVRSEQIKALLGKWKQSKLFGFGYGSYVEGNIRGEQYPYVYESTLPALIMKIGIVGCVLWIAFILATTVSACSYFWKTKRNNTFWWLGLALSYAMAVQTNPFLFTFTGFSILLFLLIAFQEKFNRIGDN